MTLDEDLAPTLPWPNPPLLLYHGTLELHVPSLLRGIDLRHSRPRVDFGSGFYTTTNRQQAWELALARAAQRTGNAPALVRFSVSRDALADLRCLSFVRGDPAADDFWSFVDHQRSGRGSHGSREGGGWYDVVVGPVALDWRARRIRRNGDQLSFHTARAIAPLNESDPRRIR